MDRQYVVEHNIVDRYLRGELNPEEAVEFEEFYLDDPETLNELEVGEVLGEHAPQQPDPPTVRTNKWWFSGLLVAASSAASILVMLAVTDQPEALSGVVGQLRIEQVRGPADPRQLTLPARPGGVLLSVEIPPNAAGPFRLELDRDGAVQSTSGLLADGFREISVVIPIGEPQASSWMLRVFGSDGMAVIEEQIEVVVSQD